MLLVQADLLWASEKLLRDFRPLQKQDFDFNLHFCLIHRPPEPLIDLCIILKKIQIAATLENFQGRPRYF